MSRIRSPLGRIVVGITIAVGALAGTTVGTASAWDTTATHARVTGWVDGDTVRTTKGTVRLIGMDTPESGVECYKQATTNARNLAPVGVRIKLIRVLGRDNFDRYGRKLRYVHNRAGTDVGYKAIVKGLADARYDGRDGYGSHPRQAKYHNADSTYRDRDCNNDNGSGGGGGGGGCSGYSPCLPPPPPDLDCADIGQVVFVNHAYGDPHNLDADGDGRGCESYG